MIFSEAEWKKEMDQVSFCGKHPNWFYSTCTISCPNCHSLGFYGPKMTVNEAKEIIRKYRACKFCGFWQEVDDGEPYRCIALYCGSCGAYDWTTPKGEEDYKSCGQCSSKNVKIDWASDNPEHAFWKLKKQMDDLHAIV